MAGCSACIFVVDSIWALFSGKVAAFRMSVKSTMATP